MPDPTSGTQAANPDQNRRSAEISALARPAVPDVGERYELHELIASGGMGAVYRAWDSALNRDVAVKLLLDHSRDSAAARRRFEYEATITAQLQHPGVPPVYELGTLSAAGPFLAMKLVKGKTLDAVLRALPATAYDRANLVGPFEAVCHAVGYAHSRGVIHRDLKPANVMVGAFGEVQVMDWGLAKFRGDVSPVATASTTATAGSAATASTFVDPRGADESRTGDGAILGTPAYMPPEQAAGAVDRVTERSDVFGLGAILCRILTDRPPFVGGDAESTRLLAAGGKVEDAFARLDASGADPSLVALAKRCLAVDPADRPANGAAVAAEVAALRADMERRVQQAEMERMRAEVRAAEQRHRQRLWAWSAAAVATVLIAGLSVSIWQMFRAQHAEGAIGQELINTKEAKALAENNEKEAKKQTKQAVVNLGHALDANSKMVLGIQTMLEKLPGTQALRKTLLEIARDGLAKILEEARKQGSPDSTLVWSHFRMGDVERNLGNTAAAEREYRAGNDLARHLFEADPAASTARRDLGISFQRLGESAMLAGRTEEAYEHFREMNRIARKAVDIDPATAEAQRDLSWSLYSLGDAALRLGRPSEALDHYRRSQEIAGRLAGAEPQNKQAQRDHGIAHTRLGDALVQLRKFTEALDHYGHARQIAEVLADAEPSNAQAQRDATIHLHKIGYINRSLGRPREALPAYQKMHEIQQRLVSADPSNSQVQRDLSIGLDNLGDVTLELGRPQEAITHYQKSLALRKKLADSDPTNAQVQRDLGISHGNLGDAAERLNRLADATDHYREWTAIAERLAAADPKNAAVGRDLGIGYNKLGAVVERLDRFDEAATWHRKSLAVRRRLADADPKGAEAQRDLLVSYFSLGYVAQRAEDYAAALRHYEEALDVARRFERPELFAKEVGIVKGQIGNCKANMPPPKRREVAPAPRPIADGMKD